MKKLILLLIAALMLAATACSEITIDNPDKALSDDSVSVAESGTESKRESEAESELTPSATESKQDGDSTSNGTETTESVVEPTESAPDSSAPEQIIDSSEPTESVVEPIESIPDSSVIYEDSTPEYTEGYAVALNAKELECINAGEDGQYLILVNKENKLDSSYVPANLVDIRDTRKDRAAELMVDVAETALHAFLQEAAHYGYADVTITSGYRSIAKQESLFNYYVNNEMASGKDRESAIAAASAYSAYPGTSEHHTGLCVDMHNLPAASQSFGSTEAAKWLAANAHRFGFILRFPQGKQDITGYMWEPWHFRFVGKHHATQIYNAGLTLEEYLESIGEMEVG